MDLIEAIRTRKSIRAYLPTAVPRNVIEEILETAFRAPSAVNSQPWEVVVVTGHVLEQIKNENEKNFLAGVPLCEHSSYTGIYRQRRIELARDLFKILDIQREDHARREAWTLRGFRFYDAPVGIILVKDIALDENTWGLYDIGALSQTLCLTALAYGLGTCIEEQGIKYPDVIRKHLGLPDGKEPVMAIALGYPDPDDPANRMVSRRIHVDEATRWLGF